MNVFFVAFGWFLHCIQQLTLLLYSTFYIKPGLAGKVMDTHTRGSGLPSTMMGLLDVYNYYNYYNSYYRSEMCYHKFYTIQTR